jgi:hypothetical protein
LFVLEEAAVVVIGIAGFKVEEAVALGIKII